MANSSTSNQNRTNTHHQNKNQNPINPNQLNANMINDPLYIASSDHPGMVLTKTPFNGSNFYGWKLQTWIRCDYIVICWILNSMVTELSDAFLYAQSTCEVWKEIAERCGQSNGPMIYQLERELSKISQGGLTIALYFNKLKKFRSQILAMDPLYTVNKAYYIVQQIEKQKQVTSHIFEPTTFFDNMNNKGTNGGRKDTRTVRNDDWVTDTGASDHMTPNFSLLITVTYLKDPIIVHLLDGRSKTIAIVGSVQLTPTLILTNVFYVPEFQVNLLSVEQLIQTNQLVAHFYPNVFCIQDLSTKQIVAVGKGSRCLYI
ncbi:hypothetical protein Tco_0865965 [Tanacetum coccineum]